MCGPTSPSRFALSSTRARSIPRPSSRMLIATLERSRTAARTISPSGFFLWRVRSAGVSIPWSTAFRHFVQSPAHGDELADQIHQRIQAPQIDADVLAATPHSGRTFTRRNVRLFSATDRHRVDIADSANRSLDLGGIRGRIELERKPSVEVVRFERGRGGLDAIHTTQLLRFADDQRGPAALYGGFCADGHGDEPTGSDGRNRRSRRSRSTWGCSRRSLWRMLPGGAIEVRQQRGDVELTLATRHGEADCFFQRVVRAE